MNKILIVTPLAVEHAALGASLEAEAGFSESDHHGVKALAFHGLELRLAVGGHGKVQFALSTQLLIQQFKPDLVICAGAAGALHPELRPLDVVVGETTVEHDFRVRFAEHPIPRFTADEKIIEQIRRRHEPNGFTLHFGKLASGDEDIMDPARAREVRELTDAVAVAWEGAGGARACRLHGVPFVEIRAITDVSDAETPRTFVQHVKQGMSHIAHVLNTAF